MRVDDNYVQPGHRVDRCSRQTADGQHVIAVPLWQDNPCNHEEADTYDATCQQLPWKVGIVEYSSVLLTQMWWFLLFETSRGSRWTLASVWDGEELPLHAAHKLVAWPEKSKSLLVFHAITGCDTVSAFAGRGKKTAWDTFPEVTDAFLAAPRAICSRTMSTIERFVARKRLFAKKGWPLEETWIWW